MAAPHGIEQVARELVSAFGAGDLERMRTLLAEDVKAYITNREGGADLVVGSKEYLRRVEAMDLPSANFRIDVTQVVAVRDDLAMIMVEIDAARRGKTLHNHAAHLLFVNDGKVAEWWMVEALPEESEEFWSS